MSETHKPLPPPLRPGPLYPLLPDESDDIRVDVADVVPNPEQWLDTPNTNFAMQTPRSLIGTEQEWFLRSLVRAIKYGLYW